MAIPDPIELLLAPEISTLFPEDVEQFVAATESELLEHEEEFGYLLSHYCRDPRGSPDETDFTAAIVAFNESGAGELLVDWRETAHYGCDDMSVDIRHEDRFVIQYDPLKSLLSILGPDVPERDCEDI